MYSIEITKLQNLHETLKQFVKELNEFAWDMRTAGLGILMPEEVEIKVTLMDDNAGTFQEVEVMSGEGKTTTATSNELKGARLETVNMVETDIDKVATQREFTPITIERTVDTALNDTTTTNHGIEESTTTAGEQFSSSGTGGVDITSIVYGYT
jgi:hypothetical protein